MFATLLNDSKARRAELVAENGAQFLRHAHDFSNPPTLCHLSADHCFVSCTERRKKEAVASVSTATDAAMDAINSGTTTI